MKRGKRVDPWFPFYIDKWLFGSTRHELIINENWRRIWPQLVPLVPSQILEAPFTDLRGIYADLMTLSKKDGGFIRANERTPYPHTQLAGQFCVPLEHLELTIKICLHEDVKKLEEISPGIYFIPTTAVYALSERYVREIDAQLAENKGPGIESSGFPEQAAGKSEPIGKDRKGKDRKGEDRRGKKSQAPSPIRLILDEEPKHWEGITEADKALWAKTYPGCDVDQVLQEMIAYWDAQPRSCLKLNWKRTIVNHLKWVQDHGGTKQDTARLRRALPGSQPPGTWLKMMKEKEAKEKAVKEGKS
jgi:hypothetical protein